MASDVPRSDIIPAILSIAARIVYWSNHDRHFDSIP